MPTYHLGRGNDVFKISGDNVSVYGEAGNDTISGSGNHLLADGGKGADQFDWLRGTYMTVVGGSGNDTILLTDYSTTDNIVYGGSGDDNLRVMYGRYNTVHGGSGNDIIRNEGGDNVFFGGSGNDTVLITYGSRLLADCGNGDDSLSGTGNDNTFRGGAGDDSLTLGEGQHTRLYGGAGDDTLTSWEARDAELNGGAGDDMLTASSGMQNSTLRGGAGDDELIVHSGGNTLDGGAGEDHLSTLPPHGRGDGNVFTGGGDRDLFSFDHFAHLAVTNDTNSLLSRGDVVTGDIDRITDYQAGETLDLFGQEVTRETSVKLADPAPGTGDQGHRHVVLAAQTYAVVDGDLSAVNTFTLSPTGDDKLVLYGGSKYPEDAGAVVLENYDGDVLIV